MMELPEELFAECAVMADSLDVEQTSIGRKADLPQGGEVLQPLTQFKVSGVGDGGLGAQRAPFFVVLLDGGVFVVDVEGRDHPIGDHAGAESAWCLARDAAAEDELDTIRPPEIEIVPDDLLEEEASQHRPVEDL